MKKTGSFFFSFVPLLVALGVQMIASFFLIGISALFAFPIFGSRPTHISLNSLITLWTTSDFSTALMIIYSLLIICSFGIWYYRNYGGEYLPNVHKVFHPYKFIGVILLVPGTQLFCSYIVSFLATLFPSWMEFYEKLLESAGLDTSITLLMFFYSVILAPVAEELIFRGVTLRSARRALPFWGANLLQAFLFGVYHMNMIQGCYAFCLGLVLGYICEKGGSIYFSMFLHFLFNLWGIVISQYLNFGNSAAAFYIFLLVSIVLIVIGLRLFRTGIMKNNNSNQGFTNSNQEPIM